MGKSNLHSKKTRVLISVAFLSGTALSAGGGNPMQDKPVLTASKIKTLSQDLLSKPRSLKEISHLLGNSPVNTNSQRVTLPSGYSNSGPVQIIVHNGSEVIVFDDLTHLPLKDFVDLFGAPKNLPLLTDGTKVVKYTVIGGKKIRSCSLVMRLSKQTRNQEVQAITIRCDEL